MCVGLYATDVLNLQNEMQTYHEDMEGIPENIKKSKTPISSPPERGT